MSHQAVFINNIGTYQIYPDSPYFKAPWVELPYNFKREQQVIDAEAEEEARLEEEVYIRIEKEEAEEALRKRTMLIPLAFIGRIEKTPVSKGNKKKQK